MTRSTSPTNAFSPSASNFMVEQLESRLLLSAVIESTVEQPTTIPGNWTYTAPTLPPASEIVMNAENNEDIYGLYVWEYEYQRYREGIEDVGWNTFRVGGSMSDSLMAAIAEDGNDTMQVVMPTRVIDPVTPQDVLNQYPSQLLAVLDRYGPGGSFWSQHPEVPYDPIMSIELGNEPNFHYLYPDGTAAERADLYADLLEAGYDAIKQNYPEVTVVGFSAGGASAADIGFIEDVHEANAEVASSYDVLSTHPYTTPVAPEASVVQSWGSWSIPSNLNTIRDILDDYDRGDAPVWYTEIGWPISQADGGQYADSPGVVYVSPLLQGAYTVRLYALAQRMGVDRVYPMFVCDTDGFNGGFFNSDRTWRDSATSVDTMIDLMPNPQLLDVIHDGENGNFAYTFEPDEGATDQVTMAWRVDGTQVVDIEVGGETVLVTDMLGNEQVVAVENGVVSIEIGPLPMYITHAPAPERPVEEVFITEYFNGYGNQVTDMSGHGTDDDGWAGPWNCTISGPEYAPNTVEGGLTFNNSGYDNAGNLTGPNDGTVRRRTNDGNTQLKAVTRQFENGIEGTIWLSTLARPNGTEGEVTFWLDSSSDDYIGLRQDGGLIQPAVRLNGVDDFSCNDTYASGMTYLLIARIGIDADGYYDTLDFWVKTEGNDISSPEALGTPNVSRSGVDIFGDSLDGIGASFNINHSRLDAIRIANSPYGFYQVMGVPSPDEVFITEYFNGYGDQVIDMAGTGTAGDGWAGPWSGGSTGPQYAPNTVEGGLAFNNEDYDNAGNLTGPNDGTVRRRTNDGNTQLKTVTREFESAIGGTIWLTALARPNGSEGEVTFWLDSPADDYIGLRQDGGLIQPAVRINGVDDFFCEDTFAYGQTYLFIAHIGVDVDGDNDTLDFWVKTEADDISSPAALGTPTISRSGADIFGNSLDGIGASFNINHSRLDAIRIAANGPNSFAQVMGAGSTATEPPANALNFNNYTIEQFSPGTEGTGGTVSVEDDGRTLVIEGNGWKCIELDYIVTATTVIEFDYRSTVEGEIQGIGLAEDNSLSSLYALKLYGTQWYGDQTYDNYSGTNWVHYTIPVGAFCSGLQDYFVFMNDDDGGDAAVSMFRDLQIYDY